MAKGKTIYLPVPIVDRFQSTLGPVAHNLWLRRKQACELTSDQFFHSVAQQGFLISWLHKPALTITVKGQVLHAKNPRSLKDQTGDQITAFLGEHLRMVGEGASVRVRPQAVPRGTSMCAPSLPSSRRIGSARSST